MVNPRRDVTFQLPSEIPDDKMCLQITIPKGAYYARQFYAAIEQMSFWFAYDGDAAHTGAKVANLWKQALRTITTCPNPTTMNPCGCGDDCMCNQLRFHNCVLQQWDCITQMWVDVPTDGDCTPNTGPGGGTTPPGAGVCQDYNFQFPANTWTVLPFVVNSGDTLAINSLKGAGTDGFPNWYCPDGEYFLLGGCAGGQHVVGTDPVPTSPHMCVILRIGSNYYPFFTGTFTVPSGVVNQPIYISVNNSSFTSNAGTYAIDFNYCNNTTPPVGSWCQFIDFTLSPQGFTAVQMSDGSGGFTPLANWVAGQGWVAVPKVTGVPDYQYGTFIVRDLGVTPTMPVGAEIKGHSASQQVHLTAITAGLITAPTLAALYGTFANTATPTVNAPFDESVVISGTAQRYFYIIGTDYGLSPNPSPELTIASVKLSGTGVNPFGTSNC